MHVGCLWSSNHKRRAFGCLWSSNHKRRAFMRIIKGGHSWESYRGALWIDTQVFYAWIAWSSCSLSLSLSLFLSFSPQDLGARAWLCDFLCVRVCVREIDTNSVCAWMLPRSVRECFNTVCARELRHSLCWNVCACALQVTHSVCVNVSTLCVRECSNAVRAWVLQRRVWMGAATQSLLERVHVRAARCAQCKCQCFNSVCVWVLQRSVCMSAPTCSVHECCDTVCVRVWELLRTKL